MLLGVVTRNESLMLTLHLYALAKCASLLQLYTIVKTTTQQNKLLKL